MTTNVDLDALLVFAGDLEDFLWFLRRQQQEAEQDIADLRRVWGDETFTRHKAVVGAMIERMQAFEHAAVLMIDFLNRKNEAGMRVLRGY